MNAPAAKTSPRRRHRLRNLLLVGMCATLAAWGYQHYFLARPTGAGPAGPAVDGAKFEAVWDQRRVHVIGIGDSITAGLGARPIQNSYFNRLLKNPDDEFPDMAGRCLTRVLPNLEHTNYAVSGSTSDQHLEMLQTTIPTAAEDMYGIVLMTTGGNDLIHSYGRNPPRECAMFGATVAQAQPWIENYATRLNTMLDLVQEKYPGGCEIYLANIYDPTDGVGDGVSIFLPDWPDGLAIHAAYNRVIADTAAARPNVHLVDLYSHFLGHGSHCRQFWRATYDRTDPYYWYYTNVEDPNNRGYDAIRRIFLLEILQHSQLCN